MLTLVLCASLLSLVCSWTIDSSHHNVLPKLTTDVIINCHNTNSGTESDLKLVSRIRILKLNTRNNQWQTFAMKGLSDSYPVIQPSGSDVAVIGNIGQPEQSHLSVVWSLSDSETVGSYKCEVDGFNFIDEVEIIKTNVTEITAAPVSVKDLLDLFIIQKNRIKKLRHEIENKRRMNDSLEVEALRREQGVENSDIRSEIANLQKNFTELEELYHNIPSQIKESYYEARTWPIGIFALPASTDKCPESQSDSFVESVLKISLTQNPMNPKTSIVNHLKQPVFESGRYLYLRFCQKDSTLGGANWPKGSYCIYAGKGGSCPNSFTFNTLTMTNPQTNSLTLAPQNSPYYTLLSNTIYVRGRSQYVQNSFKVGFCCRSDGSADTPVMLPVQQTFYLYRHKGKCQSVMNAKVSNEWIELVTSSYNPTYSSSTVHPDGVNGRIELCYYQRSN